MCPEEVPLSEGICERADTGSLGQQAYPFKSVNLILKLSSVLLISENMCASLASSSGDIK